MNLALHYHNLWHHAKEKIQANDIETDPLLDDATDKRFGITLLVRPTETVRQKMKQFLKELKQLEPEQYYYPEADFHVTIISIISCYSGFNIDKIKGSDYIDILQNILQNQKTFSIDFKGINASPSCIMVQGFPADESLNNLRNQVRVAFKNSDLQQSIDSRYAIQTAHSTVVRFCEKLKQTSRFLQKLESYQNYNFGTAHIEEVELVFNDWYQRQEKVKLLSKFKLQ